LTNLVGQYSDSPYTLSYCRARQEPTQRELSIRRESWFVSRENLPGSEAFRRSPFISAGNGIV
jgi:hypothetical protein